MVTIKAIPASMGHKASEVVYHDDHICPLMDFVTWHKATLAREIRESDKAFADKISKEKEAAQIAQDRWYEKNAAIIAYQMKTNPTARRVEYHVTSYTWYDGFGYVETYLNGNSVFGARD